MTNATKPIAPSAFSPVNPNEVLESSRPADSGIESGFYTTERGLPWHVELSRQLGEAERMQGMSGLLTAKEALAAGGAAFTVEQWPLQAVAPDDSVHQGGIADVPRKVANVRSDTGQVLGVVGTTYRVLQNADAFAFVDALVDDGGAKYESAGVLAGGARVFLAMEVPDHIVVAGDPSEYRLFLVFSNGHDGKVSARATITVERVVCRNTLRIAQTERAMASWTARHSGDNAFRWLCT
jgi:phage/plasmid-like protein (TIGR03299 family)